MNSLAHGPFQCDTRPSKQMTAGVQEACVWKYELYLNLWGQGSFTSVPRPLSDKRAPPAGTREPENVFRILHSTNVICRKAETLVKRWGIARCRGGGVVVRGGAVGGEKTWEEVLRASGSLQLLIGWVVIVQAASDSKAFCATHPAAAHSTAWWTLPHPPRAATQTHTRHTKDGLKGS